MTFLRTPVAGCDRLMTGLYPGSPSMKRNISSSRMSTSFSHT